MCILVSNFCVNIWWYCKTVANKSKQGYNTVMSLMPRLEQYELIYTEQLVKNQSNQPAPK